MAVCPLRFLDVSGASVGKRDTIFIDNNKPFFVQSTDCPFKDFFTNPKAGIDLFRRAFISNILNAKEN